MPMIIVDASEKPNVIKALEAKVGKDNYIVENIGKLDDSTNKFIRFADFSNDTHSFFYERKTVMDFIGSRKRRLYEQMDKIDSLIEYNKGLILEGMSEYTPIYDAYWKNVNKVALQKLSPLQQVVKLAGKAGWTMSFIKELKQRNMEFVQTWNLNETLDFIIECDKGCGIEPTYRAIPKRIPEVSLEQNILMLFDGVGEKTSEKMLKEYGSLAVFIKELPKIKGKSDILDQMKEVFLV